MPPSIRPGLRVALLGMVANALLATVKLVAGLVGQSYALVADAVESFSDIASSAIVWSGLTISARPPDYNHPYGHGKAESLAALAVGLLLVGAAIGIVIAAVFEVRAPHHAPPAPFTLGVLLGVVVVKETLYQITSRVGRRIGSMAVCADSWHHRSDAITSLIAAVGIGVSLWGGPGYEAADDWAAMLASCIIALNGGRFIRLAMLELMDTKPPTELLNGITATANAVPGILRVEKVLARKMGTVYLVDMHIEVDGALPVREAHKLAHAVKNRVRSEFDRVSDVLVHVEPFRDNDSQM